MEDIRYRLKDGAIDKKQGIKNEGWNIAYRAFIVGDS